MELIDPRPLDILSELRRIGELPHVEMPNAFVFGLKESHMAFTPK